MAPRIDPETIVKIIERNESVAGPFPHDVPWLVAEIESLIWERDLARDAMANYKTAADIWRDLYHGVKTDPCACDEDFVGYPARDVTFNPVPEVVSDYYGR